MDASLKALETCNGKCLDTDAERYEVAEKILEAVKEWVNNA